MTSQLQLVSRKIEYNTDTNNQCCNVDDVIDMTGLDIFIMKRDTGKSFRVTQK